MAVTKPYVVTIGGVAHTMLLDEHDAKRYGDAATEVKARTPRNKARTVPNK